MQGSFSYPGDTGIRQHGSVKSLRTFENVESIYLTFVSSKMNKSKLPAVNAYNFEWFPQLSYGNLINEHHKSCQTSQTNTCTM